ncbi:hypothetical protein DOM22_12980 [Bdellovibrio sp. ZAP7]|uniref:hypothetical protein n=1 Tax=Bdellovibrio sp. ZAP7 TaxID=2231053 RepID=UPI001156EC7E|nr:hypothetical protein [Bdellovibrio sp. ZAP7]QDK46001.1 hypothetical protein DOM22_12980 [Bdellovibrio sp. ZAP7]
MKKVIAGLLATTMITGMAAKSFAADSSAPSSASAELSKQELILKIRQAQAQLEQINKEMEQATDNGQQNATVNSVMRLLETLVTGLGGKDIAFAAVEKNKGKLSRGISQVIVGGATLVAHQAYLKELAERRQTTSEAELTKQRDEVKKTISSLQSQLANLIAEANK